MTQITVSNLSGVAVLGPRTDMSTVANLSAVIVLGAPVEPEGTPRMDLLSLVSNLSVQSVTETGTVLQGDLPVDRLDSELTTGEQTIVTQVTVVWPSPPSAEQLAAFSRTILGSPMYQVTHTS